MQSRALERTGADWPALLHPGTGTRQRRLLPGRQNSPIGNRRKPRNRPAVSRDNVLGARFDLPNAAGERLICFAQGNGFGHLETSLECSTILCYTRRIKFPAEWRAGWVAEPPSCDYSDLKITSFALRAIAEFW